MKKRLSILFGAMIAVGLSGTVNAGDCVGCDVEVYCGGEEYDCLGTDTLYEIEVKCQGGWDQNAVSDLWLYDKENDDPPRFSFDAIHTNSEECQFVEGYVGAFKTEGKCQVPGSAPKPQKGGDKVEFEIKAVGACPP